MEVGLDIEDGLFFAELDKQISLLIMDEDDHQVPVSHSVSALSTTNYPIPEQPIYYLYTCKGTGVFIPQGSSDSYQKKKKNKRRKSSSLSSSKYQKSHGSSYKNNIVPPQNQLVSSAKGSKSEVNMVDEWPSLQELFPSR